MGLIAHPGQVIIILISFIISSANSSLLVMYYQVTDLVCSFDGKYLFTSGGSDLTVNMWSIAVSSLEISSKQGGEGIEPFVALIEGGRDGFFWQEIKEYFHYAQIRRYLIKQARSTDTFQLVWNE